MPQLAVFQRTRMQLGPHKGAEIIAVEMPCVGNGISEKFDEMIGQCDKIVSLGTIALADFFGVKQPIRGGRMAVQIAAVEPSGRGKGGMRHLAKP